ncbi:Crp/Fnr family transcriptional regulator [Albibacterium bauzanense]|nr:cyclic nucleotide-binding domain-containing protein [Albibacterium bauzanense]
MIRLYIAVTIERILDQIYVLPEASKTLMLSYITADSFQKGHILLKADRVEKAVYFIKKGIVRAFAPQAEQDVTFWFGEEGETILSMKSYVANEKGYENVELLEDCELFELKIDMLHKLYNQDIHIANWGRRLAEKELLKIENRVVSTELLSAKKRYDSLLENSPGLIQRVPLKYIASYLSITQVSLSRIRKEK